MTREEAIEIINNTSFFAPSMTEVDEAIDMAIEALEKATPIPNGNLINFGDIGSPTIKPLERKRGEWIERNVTQDRRDAKIPEWQSAKCSVCGKYHTTPYMYYFTNYDYCPNCGADMRGDEDEIQGKK